MIQRLGHRFRLLALVGLASCSADQVRYRPMMAPPAATESAVATLYLVGDGGEVNSERDAVLARLSADIEATLRASANAPVVVAFLGDNIYEEGAPLEATDEDVEKLSGQALALAAHARVRGVFLPGNHDWADGAPLEEGRAAIERQRAWVEGMSAERDVRFLPDDGCPGPATQDVADVHLIFIDSEWLLRAPEDECGSADGFYRSLTDDLRAHRDRRVVILAHHPLASGGPHGGNVSPFERGPLAYYLAAKSGVIRQDLSSRAYTAMRRRMGEAIAASGVTPLIHGAGHDHNLQVIRMAAPGQPRYQLVSGAASRTKSVRRIEGTRYATDGFGYVRLDFLARDVRVVVYAREVMGGPVRAVFACTISQTAPEDECPEAPLMTEGS